MARADREGLSLMYRIGWRIRYAVMHAFGPAQLAGGTDPQERLKEERGRKVAAARQVREAQSAD